MKRKSLAEMFLISFAFLLIVNCSQCEAIELLHWTFDQVDGDGTVVPFTTADTSGRANTGTLTNMDNPSPVLGRVGNALQFNGGASTATRDRVQIGANSANDPLIITDFNRTYTEMTFAAFVKPVGLVSGIDADTAWIGGKMGPSGDRGWQIGLGGTNPVTNPHELVVSIFDGPAGADNEIYSGPQAALVDDTWIHVAFTFKASEFLRLYINGNKIVDSVTTLSQLSGVNTQPFQVGNRGNSPRDSWTGEIDDVHLYDNALTDAEIAALIPPLPPVQIGDFNQNGKVDGADYVVWRKNVGSASALPNDDGTTLPVGVDHYNLWRSKFGNGAGSGTGFESGGAVPEPASALIAVMSSAFLLGGFGRGGRD